MKLNLLSLLLCLFWISSYAQSNIKNSKYLVSTLDSKVSEELRESIQTIYDRLIQNESVDDFTGDSYQELTKNTFKVLTSYYNQFRADTTAKIETKIINIYPLNNNKYKVILDGFLTRPQESPILLYVLELIAEKTDLGFSFSIPLSEKTTYWKQDKIYNITYRYRDTLDKKRAKFFHDKNKNIAQKLGLKPDTLTVFMTLNYQEILNLRGIIYSVKDNGNYRDGYGVVDHTIFSVTNNEDFSHDMVHYYARKVNKRKHRNWIAEEGLAYLWGDAYYTNQKGKTISHDQLVGILKKHLQTHPNETALELFKSDKSIFMSIAPEISTRSVISGIVLREIETKRGIMGIQKIVNSGPQNQLKKFLEVAEELIQLNEKNFDRKLILFIN